jgi:hypothetical protein
MNAERFKALYGMASQIAECAACCPERFSNTEPLVQDQVLGVGVALSTI